MADLKMGLGVTGGDRRPLGSLGGLRCGETGLGLKQATEHSPDHACALANFSEQLLPVEPGWLVRLGLSAAPRWQPGDPDCSWYKRPRSTVTILQDMCQLCSPASLRPVRV